MNELFGGWLNDVMNRDDALRDRVLDPAPEQVAVNILKREVAKECPQAPPAADVIYGRVLAVSERGLVLVESLVRDVHCPALVVEKLVALLELLGGHLRDAVSVNVDPERVERGNEGVHPKRELEAVDCHGVRDVSLHEVLVRGIPVDLGDIRDHPDADALASEYGLLDPEAIPPGFLGVLDEPVKVLREQVGFRVKPWFIEANVNPSLGGSPAPFDNRNKDLLMDDMFNMLGFTNFNVTEFKSQIIAPRVINRAREKGILEPRQDQLDVLVDSEYEYLMRGEFERAHPSPSCSHSRFYENSEYDELLKKYYCLHS